MATHVLWLLELVAKLVMWRIQLEAKIIELLIQLVATLSMWYANINDTFLGGVFSQ